LYKGSIDAFQIEVSRVKIMSQFNKDMLGQLLVFFMKRPLKPSGPRALSVGISFNTTSISSAVKGSSK
jgi:hypothetical protein